MKDLRDLRDALVALGAKPPHLVALLRTWLAGRRLVELERERFVPLPRAVDAELDALDAQLDAVAQVVEKHGSDDGSERRLLRLHDGQTVTPRRSPQTSVRRRGRSYGGRRAWHWDGDAHSNNLYW
jgi:23S rRNA (adenine2503-C2)-methyltransferase